MEKIKIDDFSLYKFISGIQHSDDGKHACFVIHEIDIEENKYHSNLWLLDNENNTYRQLTTFDSEKSFIWLNNETIIFPDIRGEKENEKKEAGEEFTQYYKINIHGGEASRFIRIPRLITSIKMIDENTFMFTSEYNFNQRSLDSLSDDEKAKELKLRKEEKDYEVFEEIPFWANGGGFTNRIRNRLYIYYSISNTIKAITEEFTNVDLFNLNKDHTKAVIISFNFKDIMPLANDLRLYDITNNKFENINNLNEMTHYYSDFIHDDILIFTGSDMKRNGLNENDKFYTLDLNSQLINCISPLIDVAITNSVGSDCRYGSTSLKQIEGNYLYFVTTEGEYSLLNKINCNGEFEKITIPNGSVDNISISGDSILFIGMKTNKLQEVYKQVGHDEKQITSFNEWVQSSRKLAFPEKLSVETQPGVVIDGWILKPIDFEENKQYPAILNIHGGPKTTYGTIFFHEMQHLASSGYAVFFCNPRGSDGKGNEFADIRGKYGTIDYEDIMKFTDEVLKKYPFINPEKLGVTGGSYGGYMTNWIIGHTNRFKAAASQRSISNWITEFCTTDIGYFFVSDQNSATPWDNYEKLWESSPLKYADKVTTPTLFIHSDEDYRCGLAEGIQMFTALKYHGVDSRLCMFKGENHELSRSGKPKHRLRRLREITEWFDNYLK